MEAAVGAWLAQLAVDGKTYEISRFRPLLAGLDLAGVVVTADALHTQRNHAAFLVACKQADYLFIVMATDHSHPICVTPTFVARISA